MELIVHIALNLRKGDGCVCYKCPRHLGQCICVKYCRETESVLIFDEE